MGFAPAVTLFLGGCLERPACSDAQYELETPSPQVRLPRDEGPHCDGGCEWWYYSGRLTTPEQRGFGIEATIFHVPARPLALGLGEIWVAHYVVLDELTGELFFDELRRFDAPGVSPSPRDGFDLDVSLVQMRVRSGEGRLRCAMDSGLFDLNLSLSDTREPVLHGGNGYVSYGATGHSFYYSRPRMRAQGTLLVDDVLLNVAGDLWFDRQWGRDLIDPGQTWDWFSIRLTDGSDIMLFVFPGREQDVALGTYVPAAGQPVTLTADEFEIIPQAEWVSPGTGILYETAWHVRIARVGLDLTITAVVDDQEIDAWRSTWNLYWEGLCRVAGERDGLPVDGDAYVELANVHRR